MDIRILYTCGPEGDKIGRVFFQVYLQTYCSCVEGRGDVYNLSLTFVMIMQQPNGCFLPVARTLKLPYI